MKKLLTFLFLIFLFNKGEAKTKDSVTKADDCSGCMTFQQLFGMIKRDQIEREMRDKKVVVIYVKEPCDKKENKIVHHKNSKK
jgi:hypothetical protein